MFYLCSNNFYYFMLYHSSALEFIIERYISIVYYYIIIILLYIIILDLTRKDITKFKWNKAAQEAVDTLNPKLRGRTISTHIIIF